MDYRERPPPRALAGLVECGWVRTATSDDVVDVLPDGCMDLLWSGSRLLVAGPDTVVYVVSDADHAVNRLPESFGSLTSAGRPAVKDAHVRADLRKTLENLPRMGEVGVC